MRTARTAGAISPILMALGFLLWASAFTVLYAMLSVGCELGWNRVQWGPTSLLRLILIAIWAGHMASLAWLYRVCRSKMATQDASHPATNRFLGMASIGATAAAIIATAWIGLVIPFSSLCT